MASIVHSNRRHREGGGLDGRGRVTLAIPLVREVELTALDEPHGTREKR
jgi:hypothetical protein